MTPLRRRYGLAVVAAGHWLAPWTRNRLFRKYVVPFVALVSGALLANGILEIYFTYRESRAQLAQIQRGHAQAAALQIQHFVQDVERQIGWTAHPQIASMPLEQRQLDFVRLLRQAQAITEVMFLDGQGREQLVMSRLKMDVVGRGADLSDDPRFRQTRGGRVWYGPIEFRKESEPYMTIAVPYGSSGTSPVTAAEVNLKFIWDVVSQIRVGRLGQAYVVDREGHLIAHPDISLVLRKTDLSGQPQVAAARAGNTDAMLSTDLGGHSTLVAHSVIAPLGWIVFVEQPVTEALAPLRGALLRTGLLMLVGILVAVIASLALTRKIGAPIQALQAGAARIGGGDLGHRIDVRTRDELQDLGEQFNRMADDLQESYATLEQKVEDRTRELSATTRELTRSVEELKALGEVGHALGSTLDLPTLLDTILSRASVLAGTDGGAIYEFAREAGRFDLLRASDTFDETFVAVLRRAPLVYGEGVVGRAAEVREPVQIADILDTTLYTSRVRDAVLAAGYRALLAVPLLSEDEVVGALVVNRRSPGEFEPRVVEMLRTFGTQSALAIQNARLFREIEDKSRQLEAANQHKDEFLASMSHELRTPLNAVIGFSEVLLEKMFGDVNPKQEEYLQDILASGRHLLSLINDILDLAKIEAGRMELDVEEFDVAQAVQNAIVLVRERATRKGLILDTSLDLRLGTLGGDQRKIKQVLLNLLSNAVKFTPEGGRIEVRAQRLDGQVEIAVTDTGIGIAPEDQGVVFEEFRQVGAAEKKVEGTGLGLTLSRKLIELHGGKIWVKSQVGEGSTFTFTIPVRRGE